MKPLPPQVRHPVSELSSAILVTGVMPGATVRLTADGVLISESIATLDGWQGLSKQVQKDQAIVATQIYLGEESLPSVSAVIVGVPPQVPNIPIIVGATNAYASQVYLSDLTIGAKLLIARSEDGAIVANWTVDRTAAFVEMDTAVDLQGSQRLEAWQVLGNAESGKRSSADFVNIDEMVKMKALPGPQLVNPLTGCSTSVKIFGTVPGALTKVENGNHWDLLLNGEQTYQADLQALEVGDLSAVQYLPRISLESLPSKYTVGPALPPRKARATAFYCHGLQKLSLADLDPGAVIYVEAWTETGPDRTTTDIGFAPVSREVETFDVPAGLVPPDARFLVVRQIKCGNEGTYSDPIDFGQEYGRQNSRIVEPVLQCSNMVVLGGLAPGTNVVLFSEGISISSEHTSVDGSLVIPVDPQLQSGWKVVAKCRDCKEEYELAAAVVDVPRDVRFDLVRPLFFMGVFIEVSGCLPGSTIELYRKPLNSNAFSPIGIKKALGSSVAFMLPDAPMQEGEQYFAMMRHCTGTWQTHGSGVERRRFYLTTSRANLTPGETNALTIFAHDDIQRDTPLAAFDVLHEGTKVGSTFNPFNVTVPAGRSQPYKFTVRGVIYDDATATIQVSASTPPPPPSTPKLKLRIEPSAFWVDGAFSIDKAHFEAAPSWAGGISNDATRDNAGLEVSFDMPALPSGQSSGSFGVTITIWATYRYKVESGGSYYGFEDADRKVEFGLVGEFSWSNSSLTLTWAIEKAEVIPNRVDLKVNYGGPA